MIIIIVTTIHDYPYTSRAVVIADDDGDGAHAFCHPATAAPVSAPAISDQEGSSDVPLTSSAVIAAAAENKSLNEWVARAIESAARTA